MNCPSLPHYADKNNNLDDGASGSRNATYDRTALVVDDNPDMLRLAAAMLKSLGYEVNLAGEGAQALYDFHSSPSDLVLTDYEMPTINGYQLGRRIKTANPETRVVIMTGLCRAAVAGLMGDGRIDGWLFKPFQMKELTMLLSRLGLPPTASAEA